MHRPGTVSTKQALRTVYIQKRQSLQAADMEQIDQGLLEQASSLDLNQIKIAHIYLTIKRLSEPDTILLSEALNQKYSGIRWVISKTERKSSELYHFVWDSQTLIRDNQWGIPEPLGGIRVIESEIDLIFVPLLACDMQGYRVGYGKGYYDRFLAKCRPDALKVGISMFDLIDRIEDTDRYDIPLDACLTPTETYWFR